MKAQDQLDPQNNQRSQTDYTFAERIDNKTIPFFTPKRPIGDEALLTSYPQWTEAFPDWSERRVPAEKLKEFLKNTANCITPEKLKQHRWLERISNGELLKDTLGKEREVYNVNFELHRLRAIDNAQKTPAQKLMQRALSIISYDALNPVSVADQDISEIYSDLHISEPTIQPYLHPISLSNTNIETLLDKGHDRSKDNFVHFYGFRLYQDRQRRVKLHISGPDAKEPILYIRPHEHYGAAGSIVLNGKLDNRHVMPENIQHDDSGNFMLYHMEKSPKDRPDLARIGKCVGSVDFDTVSSYQYQAGDNYFLPAAAKQIGLDSSDLHDNGEKYSYHISATAPGSVTLFTQSFAPDSRFHSTFPKEEYGDGADIEESYDTPDNQLGGQLNNEQALALLKRTDAELTQNLQSLRPKPSTIINRHPNDLELVAERFYDGCKQMIRS